VLLRVLLVLARGVLSCLRLFGFVWLGLCGVSVLRFGWWL